MRGPRRTRLRTRLFARAYACAAVQRGVRRGRCSSFSPQRLRLCGTSTKAAHRLLRGLTPAPPYSAACGADARLLFPHKAPPLREPARTLGCAPRLSARAYALRLRTARRAARTLLLLFPAKAPPLRDPGTVRCTRLSARLTPAPPCSAACGADARLLFPHKGSALLRGPALGCPGSCAGLRLRRRTARRAARMLASFFPQGSAFAGTRHTRLRTRLLRGLTLASPYSAACGADARLLFPQSSRLCGDPGALGCAPALCVGLRRLRTARRAARMLAPFFPQRLRLAGTNALGCAPGSLRGLTPASPCSAACGATLLLLFPQGSAFAGTSGRAAHQALCAGLRPAPPYSAACGADAPPFPRKAPPLRTLAH